MPLAWVTSCLPLCGGASHGENFIAFGLIHLCYHMAGRRMARVLLPLAWVTSSLESYGCTPYGAIMVVAFGLCYHMFAIEWLDVVQWEHYCLWPGLTHLCYHMAVPVWRKYYCPWPGLPHLCHCMAVLGMVPALLPLAWLNSSLLSCGCARYGASIIAFGLRYLMFAIVLLYVVWRAYYYLWPGLIHLCFHMAIRRMAPLLLPLAWATSSLPS